MRRMNPISTEDVELIKQLDKGIEVNELPDKKEVVFAYINKDELVTALEEAVENEQLDFETHTLSTIWLGYYLDDSYSENDCAILELEGEWVFPSTISTEEALAEYIIANGLPSDAYISNVYYSQDEGSYLWNEEGDWNKNRVVATVELSSDILPIQSIEADSIKAKSVETQYFQSNAVGSSSQYINNGFVKTMYVDALRVGTSTSPKIGESTDAKRFSNAYLKGLDVKCGVGDKIRLQGLPTSDPNIEGVLWNDNGVLKISSGS